MYVYYICMFIMCVGCLMQASFFFFKDTRLHAICKDSRLSHVSFINLFFYFFYTPARYLQGFEVVSCKLIRGNVGQ